MEGEVRRAGAMQGPQAGSSQPADEAWNTRVCVRHSSERKELESSSVHRKQSVNCELKKVHEWV